MTHVCVCTMMPPSMCVRVCGSDWIKGTTKKYNRRKKRGETGDRQEVRGFAEAESNMKDEQELCR